MTDPSFGVREPSHQKKASGESQSYQVLQGDG